MNEEAQDLLTRHGHLSGLTLDRYDAGELSPAARARVDAHLHACVQCRRYLRMIEEHVVPLPPPSPRLASRPSAGSATLWGFVLSGGLGLAAAAVLAFICAPWIGPRRVEPEPRDSLGHASAYTTSPAQECEVEDSAGVELRARGQWIEARPRGEGHLALVLVADSQSVAMDTDGADEDEVQEVLHAPAFVDEEDALRHHLPVGSHRIVALICTETFAIEPGDPVAAGPGCWRYELEEHFGPEQRDS